METGCGSRLGAPDLRQYAHATKARKDSVNDQAGARVTYGRRAKCVQRAATRFEGAMHMLLGGFCLGSMTVLVASRTSLWTTFVCLVTTLIIALYAWATK